MKQKHMITALKYLTRSKHQVESIKRIRGGFYEFSTKSGKGNVIVINNKVLGVMFDEH